MRKILIFISTSFLFAISFVGAKADDGDSVKMFLFSQFEKGYVILKEGNARLSAQLNYDLTEERILYIDTEDVVNELDATAVTMVVIGERSFFPVGNHAFYERIETGNKEYYINHKTRVLSKGKASGYGGYSQTASVSGLVVTNNSGNLYLLGPEEKIEGVDESSVFVKNGKKFEKINSLKSLIKLFKSHQAEIEAYSKENKTNFNAIEDVKAIVHYSCSLQ
ncbi:MAG: hypothetical protein LBB85_11880 [Dysgonamonadaceae bacterium]|jgi:hypothetical protein|nr:hypothetical protein [Dysgonamonadaceae bacterium]